MTKQNTSGRFFNRLLKGLCIVSVVCISSLSVAVDTDNDGLPDDWETANGRDPLVADYWLESFEDTLCAKDDTGIVCWSTSEHHIAYVVDLPALSNPTYVDPRTQIALDDSGVVNWSQGSRPYIATPPDLINPVKVGNISYDSAHAHTWAIDETGFVCWDQPPEHDWYGSPPPFNSAGPPYDTHQSHPQSWCDQVPPLTNPIKITNSCALDDSGVFCWLGSGFGNADGAFNVPNDLSNPIQFEQSNTNSCVIDDSGVVCWGSNWFDQLKIPSLVNPRQIGVGEHYACALDDSGVVCWGNNDFGHSPSPDLTNPVQVSAGRYHTCALSDAGVSCWGNWSGVPNLVIDPDGDGYSNQGGADAFPLDASEWLDTDLDGIGNNADTDDDNDGVPDISDAFPLDVSESVDTDGDGVGDNADIFPLSDNDSDNDGIPNDWELGTELYAENARLYISGDDGYDIYFNGELIGSDNEWEVAEIYEVTLRPGKNVLAVKGVNDANGTHPGAFIATLSTDDFEIIKTDSSWSLSLQYTNGWQNLDGSLEAPVPATTWGNVRSTPWWGTSAWKLSASNFPVDSSAQWIWSAGLKSDSAIYTRKEFYFTEPLESDTDGDGVSDRDDDFPLDVTETIDTDSDGIGNNEDTDDDNDGFPDGYEVSFGADPLDGDSFPRSGLNILLIKGALDIKKAKEENCAEPNCANNE